MLPTIGSKELVALLPLLLGLGPGDVVVHPRAAYPTYEVGARLVGADAVRERRPGRVAGGTRLVWLNSPGQPRRAGARMPRRLRAAVARARELGAVLARDECYAELGWDAPWDAEPIPSVLDPRVTGGDVAGVLSVYSLSKQSNLAGYRAAFLAGDPALVERLLTARKHLGLDAPRARAGGDGRRARRRRARRGAEGALPRAPRRAQARARGGRLPHRRAARPACTCGRPRGATPGRASDRLADLGILAGPGHFYGTHFPQHVRLSLTATDERIAAAAARLHAPHRVRIPPSDAARPLAVSQ